MAVKRRTRACVAGGDAPTNERVLDLHVAKTNVVLGGTLAARTDHCASAKRAAQIL
jgi:hypothetical protein